MRKRITLLIDALINAVLGGLLLMFPFVSNFLGVPQTNTSFYPNILGGVLAGVAVALVIEALKKEKSRFTGLGLIGAVSINLCGGIVLTFWLLFGNLVLPLQGSVFLWTLAGILLVINVFELIFQIGSTKSSGGRD
ncbi:MAG: hypothetical protein JW881_03645 [Spirochaetales bacterium]|nr:hypothetical protein [Spirochaetales bacterium]